MRAQGGLNWVSGSWSGSLVSENIVFNGYSDDLYGI